jgi:hypothetical protein
MGDAGLKKVVADGLLSAVGYADAASVQFVISAGTPLFSDSFLFLMSYCHMLSGNGEIGREAESDLFCFRLQNFLFSQPNHPLPWIRP